MSSRTDSVHILFQSDDFAIPLEKLKELGEQMDCPPETSIFDESWVKDPQLCEVKEGKAYPKIIWWSGECSDFYSIDYFREKVLPHFEGSADLCFVVEGEIFVGVRLRNGVTSEHDVKLVLEEKGTPSPQAPVACDPQGRKYGVWYCPCGHEILGLPYDPPFLCVQAETCTCRQCRGD